MNYCPACGAPLVPVSVAEATKPVSSAGGIHSFFLLLVAGAIPLAVVLLIVTVQPSVLKEPELYFAYALIEAAAFLLLFRMFDLYEREPLSVLALMAAWGGTIALAVAVIGNTALGRTLPRPVDAVFGAAITAPIVEESAKGAALLAAFFVSWWANRRFGLLKFDGLTDGLLYGAAVGLGFAFVEDILYFMLSEYSDGAGAGVKVFMMRTSLLRLNMLLHPLATGAFGAGLGLATWSRTRLGRWGFPALGLLIAVLTHALWNGFAQLVLVERYGWQKTSAWFASKEPAGQIARTFTQALQVFDVLWFLFIALWVLAIALWLRHQRRIIAAELGQELPLGTLSRAELDQLLDVVGRSRADWKLALAGRFEHRRLRRRLYAELVDLAFFRYRSVGDANLERELQLRRRRIRAIRAELVLAASEVWAPT
jgi:RsiW-degrading membrane proteinase PrsW (M82 family)